MKSTLFLLGLLFCGTWASDGWDSEWEKPNFPPGAVEPIVPFVKPGGCPSYKDVLFGPVCMSDANCPGSQKCCVGIFGLSCQNNTSSVETPRTTITPAPTTTPRPTTARPREPGFCPKNIKASRPSCRKDSDCRKGKKCCRNNRHKKVCVTASTKKSGVCPNQFQPVRAGSCESDVDCPKNLKCCTDIFSRNFCVKPVKSPPPPPPPPPPREKPGRCPHLAPAYAFPISCRYDWHCGGPAKCCYVFPITTGRRCVPPMYG